jgi:nitronate monooxygenase
VLTTPLSRRLGIDIPVLGAPMAGPGIGRLAAAVSAAGGLGMIGVGLADAEFVRQETAIASDRGRLPFGVGLALWALAEQPSVVDAVEEVRPAVVSLSFGDPGPYLERFHTAGALVAAQVNTVTDAKRVADAGVDIVVAQGSEAGGHTGQVATLPLLQAVLDTVDLPVLAAGGIGSGRGLAAVLAAGAQGGWVGTVLLATDEAGGAAAAKRRVVAARETDTVLTRIFDLAAGVKWPQRYAGRALRNDFAERWSGREAELADPDPSVRAELANAVTSGDYDVAAVWAGQAVALVRDVRPAGEVVRSLAADAERHLRAGADLIGTP